MTETDSEPVNISKGENLAQSRHTSIDCSACVTALGRFQG